MDNFLEKSFSSDIDNPCEDLELKTGRVVIVSMRMKPLAFYKIIEFICKQKIRKESTIY